MSCHILWKTRINYYLISLILPERSTPWGVRDFRISSEDSKRGIIINQWSRYENLRFTLKLRVLKDCVVNLNLFFFLFSKSSNSCCFLADISSRIFNLIFMRFCCSVWINLVRSLSFSIFSSSFCLRYSCTSCILIILSVLSCSFIKSKFDFRRSSMLCFSLAFARRFSDSSIRFKYIFTRSWTILSFCTFTFTLLSSFISSLRRLSASNFAWIASSSALRFSISVCLV
mgnify:CR=1 FL=1